ncbi:MAG: RNA polymerase sigma factor [Bacteroidia bacterium]
MNDQKIIESLKGHKHDKVFTTLYTYFPVVKKMVLASGGRSEDAEDLYQEALIVLYRKAMHPDFKLTSGINTYLYSICRYMWNDQLRKKQKQPVETIGQALIDESEFLSEIESEKQFLLAEQAITSLGERCREILLLFYFRSKPLKDIAAKMGYSSEATAKNQKYKCLESAKLKLKALQTND